jgi:OmpA family
MRRQQLLPYFLSASTLVVSTTLNSGARDMGLEAILYDRNVQAMNAQRDGLGCGTGDAPTDAQRAQARKDFMPDGQMSIYFDSGSDVPLSRYGGNRRYDDNVLNRRHNEKIDRLLGDPKIGFHLQGCADTSGSAEGNLALSRRRAESIAENLTERGVDPRRLCIVAQGSACSTPQRSVNITPYRLAVEVETSAQVPKSLEQ